MKKFLVVLLILTLAMSSASANVWGVRGELYQLITSTKKWNEYIGLTDQAGDAVVLHTQYHNVLLLAENGQLQAYTAAIYQPDQKQKLALVKNGDGFALRYGQEEYVFARVENGYALHSAQRNGLRVERLNDAFVRCAEAGEGVAMYLPGTLSAFNIDLFPRTEAEARHINYMRAALASGADCLGRWPENAAYTLRSHVGEGNAPVYSAPDTSSWRAAKGKAAVGLKGELWVLDTCVNEKGEAYACIRYDVSTRTQRIGYVPLKALGGAMTLAQEQTRRINVPLRARCDTYLTDDPDVSQYRQMAISAGQPLTCMGLYNEYYAYVAYENAWGFVPLRDLELANTEQRCPEVMERLAGTWYFEAGGLGLGEHITLCADGTFLADGSEPAGAWYVRAYDASQRLYWNDPPCELVVRWQDGRVHIYGLSWEDEYFSLTNEEGGGGYARES